MAGKEKGIEKKKLNEKTMFVPVSITEADYLKFSAALAQIDPDLTALEAKRQASMKEMAARKAELVSTRTRLSQIVRTRTEPREVTVEGWAFFKEGLYKELRTDTGQTIEGSVRPLNPEERQERLGIDDEGKPKDGRKGPRAVKDPPEDDPPADPGDGDGKK